MISLIFPAMFILLPLVAWVGDRSVGEQLVLTSFVFSVSFWCRAYLRGPFDSAAMTLLLSVPYVTAASIDILLFGNSKALEPEWASQGLLDAGLFLLSFVVAVTALETKQLRLINLEFDSRTLGFRQIAVISMIFVTLLWCIGLPSYGIRLGIADRGELYANEMIGLTVLRYFACGALLVCSARSPQHPSRVTRRRRLCVWIALYSAYACADLIFLGDRRLSLSLLAGALAAWVPKIRIWYGFFGAVIALPVFCGLTLFGFLRSVPIFEWPAAVATLNIAQVLNPMNLEFGGFGQINDATHAGRYLFPSFPTYADALQQLVPRWLAVYRPEAPTEWFVRNFDPEIAARMGSYAFNSVVEAVANFGGIGPVFVGAVWGAVTVLLRRHRTFGPRLGSAISVFIFGFAMRMDIPSLARQAILAIAGIMLLLSLERLWNFARTCRCDRMA